MLMIRPTDVVWTEGSGPTQVVDSEAGETPAESDAGTVAEGASPGSGSEQEIVVMRSEADQPMEQEARVARWEIDAAHSEIEFAIRHLMISTIKGRFNRFRGFITFAPRAALPAAVEVEIDVASIDTGQEQRDIHLRSGDFFDVETYPTILFVSRRIELLSADHFRIVGDLRLHGVTQPITLEAIFQGMGHDPWGHSRASFTATTQIDRRNFGLTWNRPLENSGVMVGDMVSITLDIEAVNQDEGMAIEDTGAVTQDV